MKVVFIGTAGSAIAPGHNLPSILVNDTILLDCGEGVARFLADRELIDYIEYILLTHFHGDHITGFIGLAWYYWLKGVKDKINLIGPRGTREKLGGILSLLSGNPEKIFERFNIIEVEPGKRVGSVFTAKASHSIPALAYRVEIEGKSLCYTGDTAYSEEIVKLAKECDLLIHEATYPPGMEKKARLDGHSTPVIAAKVARKAKVKTLALIHLPYFKLGENIREIYLKAAKEIFPETIIPREYDTVTL